MRELLFPHPLAWVATVAMFLLVAAWLLMTDMKVVGGLEALRRKWPLLMLLLMPALFMDRKRGAALVIATVFFTLFGTAARILNHLGASLGMEFADELLARLDASLGLGRQVYVQYVAFINDSEILRRFLHVAYGTHKLAFIFVMVFLAATGRIERLREFVLLFVLTVIPTLVAGAMLPALAAFEHYQVPASAIDNLSPWDGRYYLPFIVPLHEGSMTVIDLRAVPAS